MHAEAHTIMFLINGQPAAQLSVEDRGLHYGDGVYETIAVYQQLLLCWDKHYQRLITGCSRLGMPAPPSEVLCSEAMQLIAGEQSTVIKIIITRGAGGRGYRPPVDPKPVRITGRYPWPEYPAEYLKGIHARFCQTPLGHNPSLAGIKHLNRLEQVLARAEWTDPDITEGLMSDVEGNIIEGTMSNLFAVKGNTLITPDLQKCGVAGIIRACILELAPALGFHIRTGTVSRSLLLDADEIFICNSIIGIWPVTEIDGNKCKAGDRASEIRNELIQRLIIAP